MDPAALALFSLFHMFHYKYPLATCLDMSNKDLGPLGMKVSIFLLLQQSRI